MDKQSGMESLQQLMAISGSCCTYSIVGCLEPCFAMHGTCALSKHNTE